MTRIPDFFIVGAPKCGTTALNEYLSHHPEIFVPERKEIHFFGSDLVFSSPRPDANEYRRLFAGWGGEKRAGEASVWYLYSRTAAEEIRKLSPAARIIVMLRHPVDMMYSLHSQRLYGGDEDIVDFAEALAAEPARRRGDRFPQNFRNTMGFFYRDAARFAVQVRRYFECFPRDRVHVILFDDLQRDVARVYRDTCAFLDVDPNFRPQFDVVNANKNVRSTGLRNLLHFASPTLRSGIRTLLPNAYARERLKRRLLALNTQYVPRVPMDAGLRSRLLEEFRPEIRELGDLLGRDLVALWCDPPRRPAARRLPTARQASYT
ncbi:MAG: sulfotransferase family protein [Candidatus Binatia bacterium]